MADKRIINEGYNKKGGVNKEDKTPRPKAPQGQEIIIDGVDVSDCEFYPNPLGIVSLKELGRRACFDCKSNPDCEFKRQKRFQNQYNKVVAQNKSLQLELKTKSWEISNLGYKIKNQRREINERLKQLQEKEQELKQLQEDYLLDHRDDDEHTIPLIQQIRDRLDLVDELEQECEELKKYKDVVNKLAGMQIILTNKDKMPELYENAKDLKLEQYEQILKEIKEYFKNLDTSKTSLFNIFVVWQNIIEIIDKERGVIYDKAYNRLFRWIR